VDQAKALALLKSGKNVFLTGSAGAGKTYVLNQYIDYLKDRKIGVAVTASTGIAASHMNGQTIHSWAGIGIKDELTPNMLSNMEDKQFMVRKFQETSVLIIDEISMLHRKQLDMINGVLQHFKEPFLPFGGLQVIFSGDFFQLPPVGDKEQTNRDKFAFMSPTWVDAELTICYITEQHRQGDNELQKILNEIRDGLVTERSYFYLKETYDNDGFDQRKVTQLFTHNADVDQLNGQYLKDIKGESQIFEAETSGNIKLVEGLKKSVLAAQRLELKLGARVMFVKNNYDRGYINGTLGEVHEFNDKNQAVIKTVNGDIITAEPEKWAIEDESGKVLASYSQVPLRLAWAITVHKSQGMTLDQAVVDLSKTFERGQGYVALSRLRDIKGLRLIGFNNRALEVDSLALKADKRFRELSMLSDDTTNMLELEKQYLPFIRKNGGLTSDSQIEKLKKKRKEKKRGKISTYLLTIEHIDKGQTVEQIAEARGLSPATVRNHLFTISMRHPKIDLSNYRPSKTVLSKIQKAYNTAKSKAGDDDYNDDGILKSKLIFDQLKGSVGYDEIKLALIFLDR